MFRKTHIRLTIINSLVFAILISTLGSILYFYTQHRLFEDVNRSLLESANRFDLGLNDEENHGPRDNLHFFKDRIIILMWDEQGNLLAPPQSPEAERFLQIKKQIKPKEFNQLEDITINHFTFRYYAIKMDSELSGVKTIQVLRDINSEKEFLDKLLLIILISCGIGIIFAVALGYFLAGRALIPIKGAWMKQQQFVSDASHELRTPLAVIQAKTDLLFRSPSATIEDRIIDVSTISNESRRLSKLVTNLLTLARSDSNQIEVKKEAFQLDQLLAEIMRQYEEIISYQGKELSLDISSPVLFTADKERIHQLVVILLDNAMKFTAEGGHIRLSCRQIHSSILLMVEDDGMGISEEEIPRIFDRFYQSDKARTLSEGTGLGLSIAQWIIDKHNGKVTVASKPGAGTKIEVSFPRNQKN